MTELGTSGCRLLMASAMMLAITCTIGQAAFVADPSPAVHSPSRASLRSTKKEFGSTTDDATITLAGAAGVAGLIGLLASSRSQAQTTQKAKITVCASADPGKALKNFFAPRYGKALTRDLPPNAAAVGSLKITYEVKVNMPMGLQLSTRGDGSGAIVESVNEGSNAEQLWNDYINGDSKDMWIQAGDTVEAVNGVAVEPGVDALDSVYQMVQSSPQGEPLSLVMSRPRLGAIKVCFPDGSTLTTPRQCPLKVAAKQVGYDSGCTCNDGSCGKCWHKDPVTGEVYVLPLSVPGYVPSVLRDKGVELSEREGQFECWIPLALVPAPEEYKKALEAEQEMQVELLRQGKSLTGFRG